MKGEQDPWPWLWAFGTSPAPHGLGFKSRKLWELTPKEFHVLEAVHQAEARRWAISHAAYLNTHFEVDSVPYEAADFLGTGNREARVLAKQASDRAAATENRRLKSITAGAPAPEELPAWARMTPEEEARSKKRAR